MKINDLYPNRGLDRLESSVSRPERAPAQNGAAPATQDRRSDRIHLSSVGREIQYYLEVSRGLPSTREGLIQEIRNAYLRGEYGVDPEELARKIISKGDLGDFLL